MSWRSKRAQPVPEEAPAPTAEEDAIAERLAELTHREVALRRITEVVEKQRTRLEERERALERSTSAAAAAAEKRLAEAIKRAEQAEQRVRDLEQQVAELKARPEPKAPEPAPLPAVAEPVPVAVAASPSPADALEPRPHPIDLSSREATYTLQRLEHLVEEAQRRGDPRADEWAYYLPLLREHAEPDGHLPAQFAALVDSIFAE
jgi:DNA repair exonuclease SbcCD ATPase subunit